MKEKNKLLLVVIIILTIVILILGITVLYLINKTKVSYVAKDNDKKGLLDQNNNKGVYNEIQKNSYEDTETNEDNSGVRIEFNLECQATAYKNESESKVLDYQFSDGFYGRYYIGGDIFIDGNYADGTKVSTKIKVESPVIDIKTGTNFDGYWIPAYEAKEGETYNFTSNAYFLFKDGTIGKISTDDIKNGNYKITKLNQYKNIISLVSCNLPEGSGGDCNLYAVDDNNKIYILDRVSTGD